MPIASGIAPVATLERAAYTIEEAAYMANTRGAVIRAEIHAGRLKAARLGWCWRVRKCDFDDWLARAANAPAEKARCRNPLRNGGRPRKRREGGAAAR